MSSTLHQETREKTYKYYDRGCSQDYKQKLINQKGKIQLVYYLILQQIARDKQDLLMFMLIKKYKQ